MDKTFGERQEEKPEKQARLNRKERRLLHVKEYPVQPTVIVSLDKPYNVANHSYRDFSRVPGPLNQPGVRASLRDQTFPQKLHWLLSHPVYSLKAEWRPHGRAFHVRVPGFLQFEGIFEVIFEAKRYSVFLSMLQSWGFKLLTHGKDRNCWYHELFLRGLPHLTLYFDEPRDSRRRIPDPANEPDLYEISAKYPVPEIVIERDENVAPY